MLGVIIFLPIILCFGVIGLLVNFFCKKDSLKRFVWPLAAVLTWLAFFGDTIPLRIKYYYLCASQAGYEIFEPTGIAETLEDFRGKNGRIDTRAAGDIFEVKYLEDYYFGRKKNVRGFYSVVLYKNKEVASVKTFAYLGGSYLIDLDGGGSSSCPDLPIYSEIYKSLLTRERIDKGDGVNLP